MSNQNWRPEVTGEDYLRHRKKEFEVADRRPVIRKSSDLAGMGPGINAQAIRVVDFNDPLATYDGYYSANRALNGPNPETAGPDTNYDICNYTGHVVMDGDLGGVQEFTCLDTGEVYRRVFNRAPEDAEYIIWGDWTSVSNDLRPVGEVTMFMGTTIPDGWLLLDGSTFDGALYPALATLLGGTTLPDMLTRFPIGASASAPVGTVGGSPFLPVHTHEFDHVHDGATHAHSISGASGGGSISYTPGETSSPTFSQSGHSHGGETGTETGVTSGPAPSIETDDNPAFIDSRPPWLALNFIIRARSAALA